MENGVKKKNKLLIILLIIVIVLVVVACSYIYLEDFRATKKGIVMRVNKNSLSVMEVGSTSLYSISFADEGDIGFKQGQEVLIYFDGMIAESYPAQIHNVGKIKIIKEESDVQIPENVLRYYYSSRNNVTVSISEFNSKGISLNIKDTNEYPYSYSNNYTISKKIKNENYTGIGYKIGEDTKNSTSGYTGTGLEYIWQEVSKVSGVASKDTITSETIDKDTLKNTYDWSSIYGELRNGGYQYILSIGDLGFSCITINFTINKNGELSYNEPTLEW